MRAAQKADLFSRSTQSLQVINRRRGAARAGGGEDRDPERGADAVRRRCGRRVPRVDKQVLPSACGRLDFRPLAPGRRADADPASIARENAAYRARPVTAAMRGRPRRQAPRCTGASAWPSLLDDAAPIPATASKRCSRSRCASIRSDRRLGARDATGRWVPAAQAQRDASAAHLHDLIGPDLDLKIEVNASHPDRRALEREAGLAGTVSRRTACHAACCCARRSDPAERQSDGNFVYSAPRPEGLRPHSAVFVILQAQVPLAGSDRDRGRAAACHCACSPVRFTPPMRRSTGIGPRRRFSGTRFRCRPCRPRRAGSASTPSTATRSSVAPRSRGSSTGTSAAALEAFSAIVSPACATR